MAEFAFEPEPAGVTLAPGETAREVAGKTPWLLAGRRLARNRVALAALALFVLVVCVTFAAPIWANDIAHVDPFASNVNGTTVVDGKRVDVIQQGGGALGIGENPIGPTWQTNYLLGADSQGRDVFARVLYGGRASLLIGIGSALISCIVALLLGLVAGYFRGPVDVVLSPVVG